MNKLKYLIKRIFGMNIKNMFNIIDKTHKKSGKNNVMIFLDMIWCGFKYQAGYMDYYLFELYALNGKQRKTVMTRGKNNKYISYLNNKEYNHYFHNKDEFNEKFSKFLKRDWIILNNNEKEFNKFVKDKEYIICKPKDGSCGKGIEKIRVSDYKNKNLYEYLLNNKLIVIEELINQDEVMNKLYSGSVNTIRVVSITHNGKSNVVVAYLRIGNDGKFVDNFNSGGMVTPINEKTGELEYSALDKAGNLYEIHPATKTKIVGFKIPMWNDVIKLVKEAALVIPEMGIVGWDVAISDKGVLLVEGNEYPGHDIYQLPVHRKDGIGVLPKFENILKIK